MSSKLPQTGSPQNGHRPESHPNKINFTCIPSHQLHDQKRLAWLSASSTYANKTDILTKTHLQHNDASGGTPRTQQDPQRVAAEGAWNKSDKSNKSNKTT